MIDFSITLPSNAFKRSKIGFIEVLLANIKHYFTLLEVVLFLMALITSEELILTCISNIFPFGLDAANVPIPCFK